jgi:hypothetical protein
MILAKALANETLAGGVLALNVGVKGPPEVTFKV